MTLNAPKKVIGERRRIGTVLLLTLFFFLSFGSGNHLIPSQVLSRSDEGAFLNASELIEVSDEKIEASDILIEVRERVQVSKRKYTLGEIADIDAHPFLHEQLAAIPMGFAPQPGKVKTVQGNRIRAKIKANKLFSPEMTLWVPDRMYVERSGQQPDESHLRDIYETYIDHHMREVGFDYTIRDFSIRGLDLYPQGDLTLSDPLFKGKAIQDRVTLYLTVFVDDKDQGRISLTGRVDLFDDVVCLIRPLSRGSRLTESDLNVARVNVTRQRGATFRDMKEVIGKVLTRSVRSQSPLTVNMVEAPPLIHKGDMVKVVASKGNLKIVTLGIAREDGKEREVIRVENTQSGKLIKAVVAGASEVHVFY